VTQQVDSLILSAHPDDAEFGVAGTVARWTDEGKTVIYAICTNGDKGTSDRTLAPDQLAKIRKNEQRAAGGVLGVQEIVFLDYPIPTCSNRAWSPIK
jgi:LmbE family N-acetylglucosaminyl deacetylase